MRIIIALANRLNLKTGVTASTPIIGDWKKPKLQQQIACTSEKKVSMSMPMDLSVPVVILTLAECMQI
jgi:hypothetical protein